VFQNQWSTEVGKRIEGNHFTEPKPSITNDQNQKTANPHSLFNLSRLDGASILSFLTGILPSAQDEDQEETEFANRMRRLKRRNRRK